MMGKNTAVAHRHLFILNLHPSSGIRPAGEEGRFSGSTLCLLLYFIPSGSETTQGILTVETVCRADGGRQIMRGYVWGYVPR
ncbi:hypothetical protein X949_4273 [Burkholderia pseudomallei MSHR5609]|nr:hypothetical protein X949_4273 [Burkholderia pseudomallei MSHR5609]